MVSQENLEMIAADPRSFLGQCFKLEQRIKVKKQRIDHLRQISIQITSSVKPVSAYTGPSDKIGNCAIEITALTQEIEEEIIRMLRLQHEVADAIFELVPNQTQRAVLEARYLSGMSWEEIAYNMHYAYRWVLRLHKNGLAAMKENANGLG
ncbi:MAG: hypothetical protein IJG87_06540 [Ruminococcus sp.]|nr:hypothetical protein [Ruminococcus sp.]